MGGFTARTLAATRPGRGMIVADSMGNTSARHALQAPMTIAAISGLGRQGRDAFLHATAHVTAQAPEVQAYGRAVKATRRIPEDIGS